MKKMNEFSSNLHKPINQTSLRWNLLSALPCTPLEWHHPSRPRRRLYRDPQTIIRHHPQDQGKTRPRQIISSKTKTRLVPTFRQKLLQLITVHSLIYIWLLNSFCLYLNTHWTSTLHFLGDRCVRITIECVTSYSLLLISALILPCVDFEVKTLLPPHETRPRLEPLMPRPRPRHLTTSWRLSWGKTLHRGLTITAPYPFSSFRLKLNTREFNSRVP